MLKKLQEVEIKPDSPFSHDALNRQQSIELLTDLVESTQQPFVLSIEAPWGFGKTKFVKMWKAHLESKKHICLYFNAWENDFVDDPLIAFLGEMKKFVEEDFEELNENDPIKSNWREVKRIGGGVLRKTLPLAIRVLTHGILDHKIVENAAAEMLANEAGDISEFAATFAKERLEKYEAEREGIIAFRNSLEGLASNITEKTGSKTPLVFFVDELDRCRPDFAVALLERIKHLFNVKNVVFVLAIDRNQLNQCVKTLYGMESKPDGYLRKFIDLAYQLPEPEGDNFAWNLFTRFSFNELNPLRQYSQLFVESFSNFARVFGLSLRAQEQCFTGINIIVRINPMIFEFSIVLSFLATLRTFNPNIIEELRSGQVEIENVLEKISNISNEQIRLWAEAALRVEFSKGKNAAKQLQELRRLNSPGVINSGEELAADRAQKILKLMSQIGDSHSNAVAIILKGLALSSRFR